MRERCARRDRSSSRVAAPHARATSRLTAPSPSLAPRGTANSPPRPRRRLASPSACARRYVPSRARTASEARWVVFDFPSRVFPARVVPRPRRRTKTPRVARVDRSAHVRIAQSAHRRVPLPDRHRTKPLPRRRLPRRRSPSPSAPLAAPRCDSRRDAPSSPSRTHLSSSTTHDRERIDSASRNRPHDAEAARRPSPERSFEALRRRPPRARNSADVSPSVPGGSAVVSRNRIVNAFRVSSCVHVEVAEGSDARNPPLATRG